MFFTRSIGIGLRHYLDILGYKGYKYFLGMSWLKYTERRGKISGMNIETAYNHVANITIISEDADRKIGSSRGCP